MENIQSAFNEVCRNTKNKRKVRNYKEYKCIYLSRIYNILNERRYVVGKYNIFTIYEPKERRIVSQSLQDKIINHLVSRYILYPALLPCLIKKIKDKEALEIVNKIIDSEEQGLGIGNMTSQVLAVFYLNDMDHYIKENLNVKYYVRYQDDFLLFHKSKEYLKYCLEEIKKYLARENLKLNNKSRIFKSINNYVFLGRTRNGKYAKYRNIKRKIKYKRFLYENNCLQLANLVNSMRCYESLKKTLR